MSYPKIDNLAKNQISHRALRANRDNLFKLFILSLRSLRLCARPKPFYECIKIGNALNYALPLFVFLLTFFTPPPPCHAETDPAKILADNVILYEDWKNKNFKNWDDDFRKGDTTIESDPVHEGKYAIKQKASDPGSLVHFFGDHPGVNKKTMDDVTLESYLYFPPGFQWPSGEITLWTLASFEGWGAGYNKAKEAGKPLTWAPYYIMIALKGNGAPLAFLTRADGLVHIPLDLGH
jgi:hypothetical protein